MILLAISRTTATTSAMWVPGRSAHPSRHRCDCPQWTLSLARSADWSGGHQFEPAMSEVGDTLRLHWRRK